MSVPSSNAATDLESLTLAQLLCTRLCHDLAGPVGAVAAGVELAGDDPSQIDEETLGLIGSSSAAASRKLKFLRAALGVPAAAAAESGNLRALVEGYLEAAAGRAGVPELQWPTDSELSAGADTLGPSVTTIALNLLLLVVEALPACRRLTLQITTTPSATIVVEGQGEPQRAAAWRSDVHDAATLAASTALSPKTIQPFLAGRIARAAGGAITLQNEPAVLRAIFQVG